MINVPQAYKQLAVVTVDTISKLKSDSKPLSQAVLEFGQLLIMLATYGKEDLDKEE